MNHVKFAPRVLAMACWPLRPCPSPPLPRRQTAAPPPSGWTGTPPPTPPASRSPPMTALFPVDPSQATGEIEVVLSGCQRQGAQRHHLRCGRSGGELRAINAGGDPLRVRQGRVPTTAFSVPSMTETGSPSPARPTAGTRFSAMGAPAMFRPSLWLSRTTTRLPSPMATGATSLPTRWDRKS